MYVLQCADDIKSRYTIWLAHWVNQTNYSSAYAIWQYSSKGKVAGINGNVDLDICYKDFPRLRPMCWVPQRLLSLSAMTLIRERL